MINIEVHNRQGISEFHAGIYRCVLITHTTISQIYDNPKHFRATDVTLLITWNRVPIKRIYNQSVNCLSTDPSRLSRHICNPQVLTPSPHHSGTLTITQLRMHDLRFRMRSIWQLLAFQTLQWPQGTEAIGLGVLPGHWGLDANLSCRGRYCRWRTRLVTSFRDSMTIIQRFTTYGAWHSVLHFWWLCINKC